MKIALGIDLGTQSIKIIAYALDEKKILAQVSEKLDLIIGKDGAREQKTKWYDDALAACFKKLPAEIKRDVVSIGVSGQQHGLVVLDGNKESLYNVKLWNDTSTEAECKILTTAVGGEEKVIAETHNLILTGFTAPKVLWLKNHHPDIFSQIKYILLPHNYINFLLTNSYVMEPSDASGTALFNPSTGTWSSIVCNAIDSRLLSLLPLIKPSRTLCGYTTKIAKERFGIAEGIPVSSGGGDNMMSAIGTNTLSRGAVTISLGTSGTVYGYSDTPIFNPKAGIAGFSSATGGYLPLLCTLNCTVITEAVRKLLDITLAEFQWQAEQAPIGSNGLIILPYLNGERSPTISHSQGSLHYLGLENFTRENICRAAIESASFALYGALESFRALGFKPKTINLTGGGAKNALWQQIMADMAGVPVTISTIDETAAFGAALQSIWAIQGGDIAVMAASHFAAQHTKVITPNLAQKAQYLSNYQRFKSLTQELIHRKA